MAAFFFKLQFLDREIPDILLEIVLNFVNFSDGEGSQFSRLLCLLVES